MSENDFGNILDQMLRDLNIIVGYYTKIINDQPSVPKHNDATPNKDDVYTSYDSFPSGDGSNFDVL